MVDPVVQPDSASSRAPASWRAPLIALLACALVAGGCAGRHRGPRTLATLGGVVALVGGTVWVVGERNDSRGSLGVGVAAVAAGIAAMVAAGGWMASAVGCSA